ncbi:MAG TPA: Flp pilus assembly protein CpaB [Phycisphaerae bacterium]|nr:Flp pilus assembly protein CpaB [Phycisphaerae bacterium]HRY66935.1 Flp pilus assembly protein CpaB [Phycisphaerae bacterium]HSA27883.1 Flp pilus assembly protein CpaB [Phycisphaerae bacterium]
MKGRAIIPLVVGLAVGILAIKLFADVLKKAKGSQASETVNVVCAKADIGSTVEIKDTMLELRAVPRSLVPSQSFYDTKEVIGRVASVVIPQGGPVVASGLAPKGTPAGMAVRIRDGYRAVAVKVDEWAGVAGWIKPGSRVDVVAVMNGSTGSSRDETISKVILENVEVLAVGQDLGSTGDVNATLPKSVTVLVRPDDVPKLHLASTKGTVRLAMRNSRDGSGGAGGQTTDKELVSSASAKGGAVKTFLNGMLSNVPKIEPNKTDKEGGGLRTAKPVAERTEPAPVAKPTPWRVEVMAGGEVQELWFENGTKDAHRVANEADGKRNGRQARPTQPGVQMSPAKPGPQAAEVAPAPYAERPETSRSKESLKPRELLE